MIKDYLNHANAMAETHIAVNSYRGISQILELWVLLYTPNVPLNKPDALSFIRMKKPNTCE